MKKFCLVIAVFLVFVVSCDNLYNDVAEEKKDMQKLIFVNADGVSVDLTKDPYGITKWEGFSKVDLNLQTQQVPSHDGSVYLDGLLSERELSVTLAMNDDKNLEKRYRLRRELIEILNPKLGEGTLIYTNNYTSKQIKVVPQTPLFETHNSNDSGTPKASLAWTACDPYWEDLEETKVSFDMLNPVIINNTGDIPCNPQINIITAYVENVAVRNMTTSKRIRLNGTIDSSFIIKTEQGEKSIIEEDLIMQWTSGGILQSMIENEEEVLIFGNNQVLGINEKENVRFLSQNISISNDCHVLYKNGLYIMSKDLVGLFWSNDAQNWQSATVTGTYPLTKYNRIKFLNGIYFVVGESSFGSTIMSSSDGKNWTVKYYVQDGKMNDICYSAKLSKYIAVGNYDYNSHYIYTSSDGDTWSALSVTGNSGLSICWSELYEKFYLVIGNLNNHYLKESFDGITWTDIFIEGLNDLGFGKTATIINIDILGIVITAHFVRGANRMIIVFYDGFKWDKNIINSLNITSNDEQYVRDIIYSTVLNKFLICAPSGFLMLGNNPFGFETFKSELLLPIKSVISKNGKYYGGTKRLETGYVVESDDGKNWGWRAISCPCNVIFYSDLFNKFYAICDKVPSHSTTDKQIAYSNDFEEWNYADPITVTYLNAVAEGNGIMLVGGAVLLKSTDGITFSYVESNISNSEEIETLCFFEKTGLFYANISGDLRSSPDGETWTSLNVNLGSSFLGVVNNVLFACGTPSKFTKDGENWREASLIGSATSVSYDNKRKLYFAVQPSIYGTEYQGCVFISSDLIHWSQIANKLGELASSCYNSEREEFIACAYTENGNVSSNRVFRSLSEKDKNLINKLSSTSDMGFSLEKGENIIQLSYESGSATAELTYRQKYLGV